MKKSCFQIKEYGLIIEGGNSNFQIDESNLELNSISFNELSTFIEENQDKEDFNKAFVIFKRNRRRFIRAKSFVGLIETKSGLTIEILPKIYSGQVASEGSSAESKKVLLRMLACLKDTPFIQLNDGHVDTKEDFPILEIFITNFISAVSDLVKNGLRGDYVEIQSVTEAIKGKLSVTKSIRTNITNRVRFHCIYDEFQTDQPANRIIKMAVVKLFNSTIINKNRSALAKLIEVFDFCETSLNLHSDFKIARSRMKRNHKYLKVLDWCEVFLFNRGFTNFQGNSINTAVLFPMEKLFEYYIAELLAKFSSGIKILSQDKRYFLLHQKRDEHDLEFEIQKFRLKPDIVLNYNEVIIDTKWKLIDSSNSKFNIKESDVYQMHAYGTRYKSDQKAISPRLALLYPLNLQFRERLLQFKYPPDLLLDVLPFDLLADPKTEIEKLISEIGLPI